MQKIYVAANLPEAHLIRSLLEHEGIEAHIVNEHLQGGAGELPPTLFPEVWIENSGDVEAARRMLDEYEKNQAQVTTRVRCTKCGEENPGNFQLCWNCNSELDPS